MSIENDPRSEHVYAHPYFLRGVNHERQRIISLLETEDLHALYLFPQGIHAENCHVCAAIALIKGENYEH